MRTQLHCLALAIVLLCSSAAAQWMQTNGPYGGCVSALATSGTNLFAGTNNGMWGRGGLFLSTNNGTGWIEVMNGLAWEGINAIGVSSGAAGDTDIFVGLFGGVFRSTNNGTSWTGANTPFSDFSSMVQIGTNLFAGARGGGGVFLSTNNGTTWTAVNEGLPKDQYDRPPSISALAVSGQSLFAVVDGGGAFLSTNNGTSWTQIGPKNATVSSFAVSGTNLIAGTSHGLFLSTNNGVRWAQTGITYTPVWSIAGSGTSLFARHSDGMFRSTNNGIFWTGANTPFSDFSSMVQMGTNLFAGARSGGGVFLSTNDGTSWTEVNNGLTSTDVNSFSVSTDGAGGTNLFAATWFNGVFLSTNNGASWTAANSGLADTHVEALAVSPDGMNIFAGAASGGVFRSTNNGTSWAAANSGIPLDTYVHCFAIRGSNLFAGTGNGVFLSTNSGTNWTAVSEGLPRATYDTTQYVAVSCLASSGQNLFAGTYGGVTLSTNNGTIWLSTNNGTNWTAASTGLKNTVDTTQYFSVECLASSGKSLFAGTYGGVFLSTNSGTNWTAVSEGLPRATYDTTQYVDVSCLASSGQNLFAVIYGDCVFVLGNNGMIWSAVNTGLTDVFVRSLAVSGTNLLAGTDGSGIWRRPLAEMITAVKSSAESPTHFTLCQNYPNPFNPSTTIKFELPKASHVTLTVYDVLGREVSVLVNERKDARVHKVKFDGSNLASGVYFYRLQAGDYVATKRLLLLK